MRWVLLAAVLLSMARPCVADEGDRLASSVNFGVTFNPLGVRVAGVVGPKWQLYSSNDIAFSDNFVSTQFVGYLSPAHAAPGVRVVVQPASFFNIGLQYRYRLDFPFYSNGAFYSEGEQPEIEAQFSGVADYAEGESLVEDIVEANADRMGKKSLYGMHLLTGYSTLQFQAGSFLAMFLTEITRVVANFPQSYVDYSYESVFDTFVHRADWVLEVTGVMGYQWRSLQFLIISSNVLAFKSGMRAMNLGPGLRWVFAENWNGVSRFTLLGVCRWHVDHLWRTQSPGIPNVAAVVEAEF